MGDILSTLGYILCLLIGLATMLLYKRIVIRLAEATDTEYSWKERIDLHKSVALAGGGLAVMGILGLVTYRLAGLILFLIALGIAVYRILRIQSRYR